MAKKEVFRVVSRGERGELRYRDYSSPETLLNRHIQIGVDDCSTNLSLRGLPVFKGLIGPMAEGGNIVRYESPDVFECLTKEWMADAGHKRSRRRRPAATVGT